MSHRRRFSKPQTFPVLNRASWQHQGLFCCSLFTERAGLRAYDISGRVGSLGTLESGASWGTDQQGKFAASSGSNGGRIDFDLVASGWNYSLTQTYTVLIYAKKNSSPVLDALVNFSDSPNPMLRAYWWSSGNGMVASRSGGTGSGNATELSASVTVTDPHVWGFTYDGSSARVKIWVDYEDLSANGTAGLGTGLVAGDLTLGEVLSGSNYGDANYYEVRLYDWEWGVREWSALRNERWDLYSRPVRKRISIPSAVVGGDAMPSPLGLPMMGVG